jgi:UDP-N-acetylglucosamine 1-carboxyvinyltransferase
MDKIVIEGGARLRGEIKVSGAKNAALPLLASSLLASGRCAYKNVPQLNDVKTMNRLLGRLGCEVESSTGTVLVTPPAGAAKRRAFEAPYELVKTMRASVLVLGPLVARFGRARVSMPGGCAIGARPIDQHLKGLEAMGAKVTLTHGYVECEAKRLRGARIVLDIPTVTGCENLMMAAALARGVTVIENAAREPEVEELAQVLVKMGARIEGAGTPLIQIEGVDELHPIEHAIVPDRIEAGTFMVAAALTRGDVLVRGALPEHQDAVIAKLRSAGVKVTAEQGGLRVRHAGDIGPLDITTQPYPGFPTDMQAQLMVLCCLARGQSVIKEAIFENRYMHVPELGRMGADIHVDGRVAVIRGVPRLSGATVMATDLRASASLVLAGLVAGGTTEVLRVYHLDRGYERIERKLRAVGAQIRRAKA